MLWQANMTACPTFAVMCMNPSASNYLHNPQTTRSLIAKIVKKTYSFAQFHCTPREIMDEIAALDSEISQYVRESPIAGARPAEKGWAKGIKEHN